MVTDHVLHRRCTPSIVAFNLQYVDLTRVYSMQVNYKDRYLASSLSSTACVAVPTAKQFCQRGKAYQKQRNGECNNIQDNYSVKGYC